MKKLRTAFVLAVSIALAIPVSAQTGNLKDVRKNVPATKKLTEVQKDTPATGKSSETKTGSTATPQP